MNSISDWREIQRRNFTSWDKLVNFLELSDLQRNKTLKKSHFPLNLPYRLAAKIEKGNLEDPILLQFLPLDREEEVDESFSFDPLGERAARVSPKLLHKYKGRVLITATKSCAMNCRYCFRRHFDYELERREFAEEIAIIRSDPSISEVILSGGDPLSLPNRTLALLIKELEGIGHLKKLRFHTRFPIGIPERIDEEFVELLERCRLKTFFVIHSNHPRELGSDVTNRLSPLQKRGVILLNQSVLLKGVNDSFETLYALSEALIESGILPYYLHHLDKVQGASHFYIPEKRGLELIEELKKHLPGYAVPRYVKEVAGEPNKIAIVAHDL